MTNAPSVEPASVPPVQEEAKKVVGDWMQTASGRQVWVLSPDPTQVVIEDVAHHLAQLPRYCGACPFPYPVAQHSVLVAHRAWHLARRAGFDDAAAQQIGRSGLMHDSAEAFLNDQHRPLKRSLSITELGISFDDLEDTWLQCLAHRFRFSYPLPKEVERADLELWATEAAQLFPVAPASWNIPVPPLDDVQIERWTFERAKEEFLSLFLELGGKP